MNKKLGLVGCGYWGPNIVRNIQKTQNMFLNNVQNRKTKENIRNKFQRGVWVAATPSQNNCIFRFKHYSLALQIVHRRLHGPF